MAKTRLELQSALQLCAGSQNKVYFQPPVNVQMTYPCIVYNYANDVTKWADDGRYFGRKKYDVTVIDRNPESVIPENVKKLPYCEIDRTYVTDNLYHFAFTIYF